MSKQAFLGTPIDDRGSEINTKQCWKQIITATFASGDTGAKAINVPFNGLLQKITLHTLNMTNAVTMILTVTDEDGGPVIVTPAQDENTIVPYHLSDPVTESVNLSFAISGDPGTTGGVFVARLRGI